MNRIARCFKNLIYVYCGIILLSNFPAFGQTPPVSKVLQGHTAGVTSVEFSKDGTWLASASIDGTVRIWSATDWKNTRILNHGAEIYALAISPDGKTVISGGYDRRLIFWETKSGKKQRTIEMPDWVNQITFTRSGQLVVACASSPIQIIDASSGTVKRTIDTKSEVSGFAVSADERYLVMGPSSAGLWDFASGKLLKKVQGFGNSFAFAPSGDKYASAEMTGGARVWSAPNGDPLEGLRIIAERDALIPTGYSKISVVMPATVVSFSPDGAWLATGDADKNVLFWQISGDKVSTTPTRTFSGHKMTVTDVSFSPDGNQIASASLDHTVRIWELR